MPWYAFAALKIGLFAPYDLAVHGGIGSHIRAQAGALRDLGHTVQVYGPASAPLSNGEVALAGSSTVTFGGTASGAAFNPLVFGSVSRLFARETFDVIHVHEPLMPLLPWAAVMRATAPVVGTFHVYREAGHRWYAAARPLLQPIVSRLAGRIAVSEPARRTAAAIFPGDYEVIPNGIDVRRFQTEGPRPSGLPPSGAIVLCVGRLEPRKGVAALIDAMPRVRERIGDVTLVIVGDGPDRDTLQARARAVDAVVRFVSNVDDEELPAYYQAADVTCAPAIAGESFGIVLIEALAAGKPVVASRIDGYVAAVGESPCVKWVAPGDAVVLAHALTLLLEDRRVTWRAEATRLASTYDWRRTAERVLAVYRRAQRAPTAAGEHS